MSAVSSFFQKVAAVFLAAFVLLAPMREAPVRSGISFASSVFQSAISTQKAKISRADEDCRLSFAAVSDLHIRRRFPTAFRAIVTPALNDMASAEDRLDAVVFDGDITDEGSFEEWDLFADMLARHSVADQIFLVAGNHDCRGPNREEFNDPVDGVKTTFIRYNQTIAGRVISQMYYSDTVNGYPFLVLGSESDHTGADLSDEQLSWFEQEMQKASASGLPVFVFLHQPLNGTHGLPFSFLFDVDAEPDEGGAGDQSEQLTQILKRYDNVFFISGHIHAGIKNADAAFGLDYASVEFMKNDSGGCVTLINLPSFLVPDVLRGGHPAIGSGWVIEVYDKEVRLRARNFITGNWLRAYDVVVPFA